MSMWNELATAFCLLLVLEGMIPFLYPGKWRRMVQKLSEVDDKTMRVAGLVSMVAGAGLLYLVRQ